MHKLYITCRDNQVQFFAYQFHSDTENVIHVPLNQDDILAVVTKLNTATFTNVEEQSKSLTVTLSDGEEVLLDDANVFRVSKNLSPFLNRIVDFVEQKNIEKFKEKIPEGYSPKVNRHKSKKIGTRIVAGGLAAMVLLGSGAVLASKKVSEKTTKFGHKPTNVMSTVSSNFDKSNLDTLSDNVVLYPKLELSFEPLSDGKLESTIDYCGDLILYYSNRYGLPYSVTCPQITQERPNITSDGVLKNPCQLTNFAGNKLTIPVYDENGPTGEYDSYTVTEDMVDSLDWNIKVGVGYLRACTNKYDSIITGLFAYNQGINALSNACSYYNLNLEDYKGDENALKARDLVVRYYQELEEKGITKGTHGDPYYLENVFRYANEEDRGALSFEYFLGDEVKTVEISSSLEYNNDLGTRL